jgi:sec-independent protein translocase protein TatC
MTFWDHLDELRGVLIRMAITVAVVATVMFCVMPQIFDSVILAPCHASFPLYRLFDRFASLGGDAQPEPFNLMLINTNLASQFFTHLSLSFQLALILSFPVLIYQLWRFVAPGLYQNERRNASSAFLFGNLLFYLGVATAYFMIFPLTLRFLATYHLSAEIPNTITLDSYMDNFMSMIFVMGITFEIPLLTWILGRLGLLTRSFFNRYRRHAIVALVVAAAVITPTSDPFTLTAVFIPLYLLWELSAALLPKAKPQQAGKA